MISWATSRPPEFPRRPVSSQVSRARWRWKPAVRPLTNRHSRGPSLTGIADRDDLDLRHGEHGEHFPEALGTTTDVRQCDLLTGRTNPCPPRTCRGTMAKAVAAAPLDNMKIAPGQTRPPGLAGAMTALHWLVLFGRHLPNLRNFASACRGTSKHCPRVHPSRRCTIWSKQSSRRVGTLLNALDVFTCPMSCRPCQIEMTNAR